MTPRCDNDTVTVPSVDYVAGLEQELSELAMEVRIIKDRLAKAGIAMLGGERCVG